MLQVNVTTINISYSQNTLKSLGTCRDSAILTRHIQIWFGTVYWIDTLANAINGAQSS